MAGPIVEWLERLVSGPPKPPAAPAWFHQQTELAKWLVALASGLTAFGFSALKDEPVAGQLALLQWSGGLLLASSALALLFILNSHAYERLREQGLPADSRAIAGPDLLRRIAYPAMMLAFIAGNGVFLVFAQAHLAALTSAHRAAPVVSVTSDAGGSLLVAQRGDRLWVLRGADLSAARWTPLPAVPPEFARRTPPVPPKPKATP